MLRWLTAGESHGPALVALADGFPAGVEVTSEHIAAELARRRQGHGRGARMSFEQDRVRLLGGVRHGVSLGGPVAIEIENTEWPKWAQVMSADPVGAQELAGLARGAPLTRPRPGHADLVGMQKYGHQDARPVLERASARETAARVALGAVAKALLRQAYDIELFSHVVRIGGAASPDDAPAPELGDRAAVEASPVRAWGEQLSTQMVAEIDRARADADTLGGVVEVLAFGLPPGLGSHVQWDRKLDSRLAGALMGIQAIKGVEVGDGFRSAARRGSVAHDEIDSQHGQLVRRSARAGGVEGGMSTGQPLRIRAAMKPISSIPRALATVDLRDGSAATAINQRSDTCAVPAAGVVAEAMVAMVLAEAALEKFGGDCVAETRRNWRGYLDALAWR